MNYLVLFLLLIIVVLLTTNREPFTEMFGFSGHTKPVKEIKLDDAKPDLSKYKQVEAKVDHDMMEIFVQQANKEIMKRTGLCTYIIETTTIRKYTSEDNDLFECMFMVIKKDGFSFGFSVVASFEVKNKNARLVSIRTQPIDVEVPGDVTAFTGVDNKKEFVNYSIVKEANVPTKAELDLLKNKLQ